MGRKTQTSVLSLSSVPYMFTEGEHIMRKFSPFLIASAQQLFFMLLYAKKKECCISLHFSPPHFRFGIEQEYTLLQVNLLPHPVILSSPHSTPSNLLFTWYLTDAHVCVIDVLHPESIKLITQIMPCNQLYPVRNFFPPPFLGYTFALFACQIFVSLRACHSF